MMCRINYHFELQQMYQESRFYIQNLLYYDVKNLTSILNSCISPKCVTSTSDNILSDNQFWLTFYNSTSKSSAYKQVTYYSSLQCCEELNFQYLVAAKLSRVSSKKGRKALPV